MVIFGLFIFGSLILFATLRGSSKDELPSIVIWGTIAEGRFNSVLAAYNEDKKKPINVSYEMKRAEDFDSELVEALANSAGPDAIIVSQDMVMRHQNKIYPIPYESFSQRALKDTFVQEAELFATSQGILGFPFMVDPLVMYWNRDLFSSAGIATAPETWNEFYTLPQKLTKRDQAGNIIQSAVALGEFSNILNAKDILSALFLQVSIPITYRAENTLAVALNDSKNGGESVLRFYTEFANPIKEAYSWNRTLQNSQQTFLRGDVAVYFGFASEYFSLRNKNPNLNFDMAVLPQLKDTKVKTTYGNVYAFSMLKSTKNPIGTFQVLSYLFGKEFGELWLKDDTVAPARRDLLSEEPTNPIVAVAYRSALISRGWLDPNRAESVKVFKSMVERVTSGQARIGEALTAASQELQSLVQ